MRSNIALDFPYYPTHFAMSRQFAFFGVGLAVIFGVTTSYTALAPELKKQKEEREGVEFKDEHGNQAQHDTMISREIAKDFKEAREKVEASGFAWGIRQALFGKNPKHPANERPAQQVRAESPAVPAHDAAKGVER